MATEAPNKPIELHMSSYGGDTYAMLKLHDEILNAVRHYIGDVRSGDFPGEKEQY